MPNLQRHERFNKVFSYLINTAEDRMLAIHAQAQRAVRRDAIGPSEFDALPPEVRDTGLLASTAWRPSARAAIQRPATGRPRPP